jgi:hypothetical protein
LNQQNKEIYWGYNLIINFNSLVLFNCLISERNEILI